MTKTPENVTEDENIGDITKAPLMIHKQYLKDMSFENPNAPGILHRVDQRPEMDMNIMLDVQKVDHEEYQDYYEVTLTLGATAKRGDETLFLAEVIYGAAVSINGIAEKQHHPLLFIEVPHMIFPFARQILANATQSGGFMPLQLAPVDFRNMYLQRFANNKNAKTAEDAQAEATTKQ